MNVFMIFPPPFEFKKDLEIDLLRSKLNCRKNAYLNLLTDLLWEYSYANGWQEALDDRFAEDGEKLATCVRIIINKEKIIEYYVGDIRLKQEQLISSNSKEFDYNKVFGWQRRDDWTPKACIKGNIYYDTEKANIAMNEIVKPFCETFMQYFVDLSQIKDDNNHTIISL
ncbi:MAG: hypothetical protein ACI4KH_05375 [Oscillospiraceae bacterium]